MSELHRIAREDGTDISASAWRKTEWQLWWHLYTNPGMVEAALETLNTTVGGRSQTTDQFAAILALGIGGKTPVDVLSTILLIVLPILPLMSLFLTVGYVTRWEYGVILLVDILWAYQLRPIMKRINVWFSSNATVQLLRFV